MKTKRINGQELHEMLKNGLRNLRLHEEEINDMNVFPVADGDTGTNMRSTLESGIRGAVNTTAVGAYLKSLSGAMLLGARGNSGVILSQLFKGIFNSLSRCGTMTPGDLRNALISGYKTAYSAVIQPVEGTILTVTREGIEQIRGQIDRDATFEHLLSLYAAEMKKSLSHTPEMLPQLKEAGVLDSGAMGYILIVEGMLMYLYGQILPDQPEQVTPVSLPSAEALENFHENSVFESGYCLEFILQLMRGDRYDQNFRIEEYIRDLKAMGESLVVVQDGWRVKVHIHTMEPPKVLGLSQKYGEFVTCKVENMQIQHNMVLQTREEKSRSPFGVIAVGDGPGMEQVFRELGCSCVLSGGEKMSVSVQDFLDALKELRSDCTVILPNNHNLIPVAVQAQKMYEGGTVVVLETETVPQGYCALAMDVPDEGDSQIRIRQIRAGAEGVMTLSAATASREYHGEHVECDPGMAVALLDGGVLCAGETPEQVFCRGLMMIPEIEEKESCVIFRGRDVPVHMERVLEDEISRLLPELEVCFMDGGSGLYHWNAAIS